ncbi:MAG: hypothetical protein WAM05_18125 [Candidatus Binataceae bacterium]
MRQRHRYTSSAAAEFDDSGRQQLSNQLAVKANIVAISAMFEIVVVGMVVYLIQSSPEVKPIYGRSKLIGSNMQTPCRTDFDFQRELNGVSKKVRFAKP